MILHYMAYESIICVVGRITKEKGTDMTAKLTFYIGLNDKDAKVQTMPTMEAGRLVERIFVNHDCDGATITSARGVYKHEDGTIVTEETIMVYVFEFGEPLDVRAICNDLKVALNQESIAVERRETDSALY